MTVAKRCFCGAGWNLPAKECEDGHPMTPAEVEVFALRARIAELENQLRRVTGREPGEIDYILPWCTHHPRHILPATCSDQPAPSVGEPPAHFCPGRDVCKYERRSETASRMIPERDALLMLAALVESIGGTATIGRHVLERAPDLTLARSDDALGLSITFRTTRTGSTGR